MEVNEMFKAAVAYERKHRKLFNAYLNKQGCKGTATRAQIRAAYNHIAQVTGDVLSPEVITVVLA